MKLTKPKKTEMIYGFLRGLFVAVVAGFISLIPYFWPNVDADDRLKESVETGFARFASEKNLGRQIEYLDQIDRDLKRSWAAHRMSVSKEYRMEVQAQIEQRRLAEVARQEAIAAKQERLEEIRLAELDATEEEERARLAAERQAVLEAEAARLAEEKRILEEILQKEEQLEKLIREEERRVSAERRAVALEAERQWRNERVCLNKNCTSWIIP